MKLSKILSFLLAFLVSLLIMVSCDAKKGDDTTNNNSDSGTNSSEGVTDDTSSEQTVWAPKQSLNIVVPNGFDKDVSDIYEQLVALGVNVQLASESDAAQPNELVIGSTDRQVSKNAYKHLENDINNVENRTGWLIYSYNGSLCIAYDSGYSFDEAIKYFLFEFSSSDTLKLKNGVIAKDNFDKIDYIEAKREEAREVYFAKIEEKLGAEATKERRKL